MPLLRKLFHGATRSLAKNGMKAGFFRRRWSKESLRRSFCTGRSKTVKSKPEELVSDKILIEKMQRELQVARDQIRELQEREEESSRKQLDDLNAIAECVPVQDKAEIHPSPSDVCEDDDDSQSNPQDSETNSHLQLSSLDTSFSKDLPAIFNEFDQEEKQTDLSLSIVSAGEYIDRGSTHETAPLSYSEKFGQHGCRDTQETLPLVGGVRDSHRAEHDKVSPPSEVVAIHEAPASNLSAHAASSPPSAETLAFRLAEAEKVSAAYRSKLEAANDLTAKLFRDLAKSRRGIHTLASRIVSLVEDRRAMKVDEEENMVRRSSLLKACVYLCPVFILCGGLDSFLATILLVWVLLELETLEFIKQEEDDDEESLFKTRNHWKDRKEKCRKSKKSSVPKEIETSEAADPRDSTARTTEVT